MRIIKAPNPIIYRDNYECPVFLAGSIEMGAAENWQDEVANTIGRDRIILNPRRDDWDSSWIQSIYDRNFREQVNWELDGIEKAYDVIFYFAENTKSPITLMELGLVCGMSHANNGVTKAMVYCHPNFWRKGNIEVMCSRYAIPLFEDKKVFLDFVRENI